MTTTNGWPGKPGVPLNPESDGWHWLQAKYYDDPVGPLMAFFWNATQQTWPKIQPYGGSTFHYLGPCLTPDEVTALQKRIAELEAVLDFYACVDHYQAHNAAERQEGMEGFGDLVAAACAEAIKAMRKFPQPNYVISKIAEEAGEVVKAAIHCAEKRETAENVAAEMKQLLAMLIRLWVEGDQVHGLPPIAAAIPAAAKEVK